ncbi:MAG: hypothetical protein IT378_10095, partial [Sandaracinaceae bacterium]|nr:hypothetical protein [Sandaracinaceae bacterium]
MRNHSGAIAEWKLTRLARMTAARLIRPKATYAILRRVEGRRFFLRPDKTLTALFTWCLAV